MSSLSVQITRVFASKFVPVVIMYTICRDFDSRYFAQYKSRTDRSESSNIAQDARCVNRPARSRSARVHYNIIAPVKRDEFFAARSI